MIDLKVRGIQRHLAATIGETITRYETAELLFDDGTWGSRPDLPIRLYTGSDRLLAISWSRFDDLWLTDDSSLPFPIGDSTIRWVSNGVEGINAAVGASIGSVMLGKGEMSIGGNPVEIWTRLVIGLDQGWLEVFNALDENGYAFHADRPAGVFIPCLPGS
ncbi:hypothetical protein [Paludisphaera soli]|uniref:hypothetical protein n=1 Tax=Paludisphaera soli TaxID=2712865 RepID=UPI0013E9ACA4|nr:hypothetical protein [Paludisphaera soli]